MILTRVKNEIGATAIEYGLIASLIGVATITGLQLTGVKLDNTYCYIATQISKAVGGSGGGCSATSSSNSNSSSSSADGSSSSVDNSGSSADSSSADASSSADSSSASSSQENNVIINTGQNAFHGQAGQMDDFIQSLADNNITSITGIYDEYGNELSTPEKLMNYFGVSMDTYNDAVNKTSSRADYNLQLAANKTTPWIYSKDLTRVSVGNSNGVYSYDSKNSSGGFVKISGLKNTSFNIYRPGFMLP
ncbi:MAG: Flp family type IVb pilin [Acetobacter fabarum]|jgi:Flp pilus assembly pilin Flp|uniref:Flp family type IVb pilin n=1 Tax=Acetobacter fabarum TaxID=483199 RepID=UPI00242E6692|nr:Flp family type IVb pilin [Acetobacter fabarum]MCH4024855.1 Flp family type IVb pilin [Acetobacter fabarum]MCI1298166.1 Flp family type IVb pilin [Acetobacter fabarum]MCI1420153.1 Flp family type IVb pilin [Acetobacter fabarum]MCI1446915.1 Flp family type IVb pilin [Acetobacter fabarum]MCI1465601.1 Flp family type IVb pilin [Acetobacter fabarum]